MPRETVRGTPQAQDHKSSFDQLPGCLIGTIPSPNVIRHLFSPPVCVQRNRSNVNNLKESRPMKRVYQPNVDPSKKSQVKAHLGIVGTEAMAEIHTLLAKRWKLQQRPSLSLLLEAVIIRWADAMKHDPKAITELKHEILARGYHPQAFKVDGDPAKLALLVDGVAKAEAVNEAESILRSH